MRIKHKWYLSLMAVVLAVALLLVPAASLVATADSPAASWADSFFERLGLHFEDSRLTRARPVEEVPSAFEDFWSTWQPFALTPETSTDTLFDIPGWETRFGWEPIPTYSPEPTPEAPAAPDAASNTTTKSENAIVLRVKDGDTIEVRIDGRLDSVRYIGIDTPEEDEPCYYEASQANWELVAGRQIRLESDVTDKDKYDRLLRYVYVDGTFVNRELVRLGYARVYPKGTFPDNKYYELLKEAETAAKRAGRGIWGDRCLSGEEQATTPPTEEPAPRPAPVPTVTPAPSSPPDDVTAICKDGTYSYSKHRSGTCSHHGGVKEWINRPPD